MANYKQYGNWYIGHSVNDTIPSATNKTNYFRLDTDTSFIYRSDGSSWVAINSPPKSYSYSIYKDGSVVKSRNNKTGTITSNANLDPLITTILASGDPSFEVQSGTYDLSSGYSGWTVPSYAQMHFDKNCIINVPNGYTGYCFLYTNFAQYTILEGGYWTESGTPAGNWDWVYIFPDMTPSEEGVLNNSIRDAVIYKADKMIHLKTDTTSWINSNLFHNLLANWCKYTVYKEHVNSWTVLASGMNVNTFIDVRMQSQGTSPQAQGGVVGIDGDANTFINCSIWDLQAANASARSLDISTNARYTTVIGGYIASYNVQDLGKYTQFHDKYFGVKSHKLDINAIAVASTAETIATFKVEDDTTGSEYSIRNGTVTNSSFIPAFWYKNYGSNNLTSFHIADIGTSFDTGTNPLFVFDGRRNNANAIVTRPLIDFRSFGTSEYLFSTTQADWKSNSLINAVITASSNTLSEVVQSPLIKRSGRVQPGSGTLPYTVMLTEGIFRNNIEVGAGTNSVTFDTTEGYVINLATSTTAGENAGLIALSSSIGICRRLFGAKAKIRCKIDTVASSVARFYFGFTSAATLPITDTPLAVADHGIIVGFNSTDTAYNIYHNDGATSVTKDAITGSPAPDTNFHTIEINWTAAGNINVVFDGTSQTISTDLPATTQNLYFNAVVQNVTGASRTHTIKGIWFEADK